MMGIRGCMYTIIEIFRKWSRMDWRTTINIIINAGELVWAFDIILLRKQANVIFETEIRYMNRQNKHNDND